MKTRKNILIGFSIFTAALLMLAPGCKDDEVVPEPAQVSYELKVKDVLGISGTIIFTDNEEAISVEINLDGIDAGIHPAHIHMNAALETGGIAITLNPVDSFGKSITLVTRFDDGNTVSYEQLIAFDGYVNVHQSYASLGVILAQADIGGNALTGTNISYDLAETNSSGVNGKALFEERKNGNTIVTLTLSGTISEAYHPAHIHLGSVTTVGGGPITALLYSVDGTTGESKTNVRMLVSSTPITYADWLVYDGYINVHESPSNLESIICQGNIGAH